ncbi:MAG TPA: rhomboid family intramembrane serine protease [Gammaproteobacteria bacterium]|nr:rhomboid family intramembrane serine protease [Gammaproteobacteria bacterium]
MLFFPYRSDITLSRLPFLTIFISVACLFIYWQQSLSDNELAQYAHTFCEEKKSRIHKVILAKIATSNKIQKTDVCELLYSSIHFSPDTSLKIDEISKSTTKFSTKSLEKTHAYIAKFLNKKYSEFNSEAPANLTRKLYYDPGSFNVFKMLTSAFAHGSWMHVTGNLFFFFAFSATLEIILGAVFYPLVIVALAIGTSLAYSIVVLSTPQALPTLGLSGVVMGTMGMFAYFIPRARIRCFFWFIIIVRRFGLPAWLLALWYFGWDVYDLYLTGTASGVNLTAHVSGFIEGYLIGLIFFRWRKKQVHDELESSSNHQQFAKAMNIR